MPEKIRKVRFKQGLPYEIELVHLKPIISRLNDVLPTPHRTDFYHIFWFTEGTPKHIVDFTSVEIKPNTLLFINKDRVHMFDHSTNYDGQILIFTDRFFCRSDADIKFLRSTILFNDLTDHPYFSIDSVVQDFKRLFDNIQAELNRPADIYQEDILRNLLHNFLLMAEREKRAHGFKEMKKGPDLDYTHLFMDLLDKKFRKIKSVSAYAEELNVSEKRLNQATSKILGKTPKEMIDERVLLEAKRLLAHSSQNIKEVGFELGFDEPTNFIKYFKKHTGNTPVEFREGFGR